MPGKSDEIAQIKHLEQFKCPETNNIKFHIDLQTLAGPGNVRETRFSVQAKRQDASRHSDRRFGGFERRCVSRGILFNKFRRRRCPIEPVRVRVMAASFDVGKLLPPLEILVVWLKR